MEYFSITISIINVRNPFISILNFNDPFSCLKKLLVCYGKFIISMYNVFNYFSLKIYTQKERHLHREKYILDLTKILVDQLKKNHWMFFKQKILLGEINFQIVVERAKEHFFSSGSRKFSV